MPLVTPNGVLCVHEEIEMFITGHGVGSQKYNSCVSEMEKSKPVGGDLDFLEKRIEIMSRNVIDAKLFIDGEWIKPGYKSMKKVFQKYIWIRENYWTYITTTSNFLELPPAS